MDVRTSSSEAPPAPHRRGSERVAGALGPGAPALRRLLSHRVVSFAVVGIVCTATFAILYSVVRTFTGALAANVVALSLTMALNFLANHHLTFRHVGGPLPVQAVQYAVVYAAGLTASTVLLHFSIAAVGEPSRLAELVLAIGSGLAATVLRYWLLTWWVYREPPAANLGGAGS